ncbi:hypothetical protein E2562_038300 [Oryza meyeriana var. granulata]|uniref:Uncharacterized protein n=1 Tax=Oryza meyeriana var. granulata TaxID=110450 RepID=A0A6G1EUG3_9ORYZ|nr:hypothetical protein E2562_038300 [Oryza meyeriana var. granulata]
MDAMKTTMRMKCSIILHRCTPAGAGNDILVDVVDMSGQFAVSGSLGMYITCAMYKVPVVAWEVAHFKTLVLMYKLVEE